MQIRYRGSPAGITPGMLEGFFVGWPNRPLAKVHLKLLTSSDEVILAIDLDHRRVVGFITAITDGVLSAYIPFLEVLPEYQGKGIGRELVRRMLRRLHRFYMIDLMCNASLQSFYERFGMKKATGVAIRNYERQSGARIR